MSKSTGVAVAAAAVVAGAVFLYHQPKIADASKQVVARVQAASMRPIVLKASNGVKVHVVPVGASVVQLWVPDRDGNLADVVLGFDDFQAYVDGRSPYMGSVVGRCANRIGQATFQLGGRTYALSANDGKHALHGGREGFDKKTWRVDALVTTTEGESVTLSYISEDGEEGYPGRLHAKVTYRLQNCGEPGQAELRVEFEATSTEATPVNLVQHSYFNLKGQGRGDVLSHTVQLEADQYTPVDEELIPTGEIQDVEGTPLDFREEKVLGKQLIQVPGGYDHNFVVRGEMGKLRPAATVKEQKTGRKLEVWTNAPGLQFYTGNFLDGMLCGKEDMTYHRHAGLCLETQGFPNAVNLRQFPNVVVRPGEVYRHTVVYKFSTF